MCWLEQLWEHEEGEAKDANNYEIQWCSSTSRMDFPLVVWGYDYASRADFGQRVPGGGKEGKRAEVHLHDTRCCLLSYWVK